jgi:hypothetical protein
MKDWIEKEYPWVEPIPHAHQIGLNQHDAALFGEIFSEIDLAIDAAASDNLTNLIGDYGRLSGRLRGLPSSRP